MNKVFFGAIVLLTIIAFCILIVAGMFQVRGEEEYYECTYLEPQEDCDWMLKSII